MEREFPQLAAYKGVRRDILVALKREQPLAAKDLANRLGVSPNAIRHHVKELEADGLVSYRRAQRGVGAPTFLYQLASAGETLFPAQYEAPLTRLLEHVVEHEGRSAALAVLEEQYDELERRFRAQLVGLAPHERVATLARVMGEAGYMAEWSEASGRFRLTEHNCAIRAIAERLPEVCEAEAKFFADVLTAAVERQAHIVGGCNACEYSVTFQNASAADAPASEEQR
jgi:DeoR family suf operon transcriptional repressor